MSPQPTGDDFDKWAEDHPEEAAIVADLTAGKVTAKELRAPAEEPDDDPEPEGDVIDAETEKALQKRLGPKFAEEWKRMRVAAEKVEKREIIAEQESERTRLLGEIDGRLAKDPTTASEPLKPILEAGVARLAREEFKGDLDKAYESVKERLGRHHKDVIEQFHKAKNPDTGKLETGGGAPAGHDRPPRDFESGGFREGLRAAIAAGRKQST